MEKYNVTKKYGRLKILEIKNDIPRTDNNSFKKSALCLCDCGTVKKIRLNDILKEKKPTRSCGCLTKEIAKKAHTTHGMKYTNFYGIWNNIKDRCLNKKSHAYKNYGERGIKIDNTWLDFNNFKNDMYESYQEHLIKNKYTSIDRINNNKGYSKENCKWSSREEQQNNIRSNNIIVYKNKKYTVAQLSKDNNINYNKLMYRIKSNFDENNLLLKNPAKRATVRSYSFNGETMTLKQWSQKTGISYYALSNRIYIYKWPIERVFTFRAKNIES